ncbi:MAG: 6,7-dimethyl-8-ribityllumazine synthase [Chlamydiales bacterium]
MYTSTDRAFALVVARFNKPITERLLDGAIDCLLQHGAAREDLTVAWVPGAFELPLVAKRLAESGRYVAVICLGAVIRGETAHFDYVAGQAASGILQVSLTTDVPVIFSVLTTETVAQAEMRSGIKGGNVGEAGAMAAMEMATLLEQINQEQCV